MQSLVWFIDNFTRLSAKLDLVPWQFYKVQCKVGFGSWQFYEIQSKAGFGSLAILRGSMQSCIWFIGNFTRVNAKLGLDHQQFYEIQCKLDLVHWQFYQIQYKAGVVSLTTLQDSIQRWVWCIDNLQDSIQRWVWFIDNFNQNKVRAFSIQSTMSMLYLVPCNCFFFRDNFTIPYNSIRC